MPKAIDFPMLPGTRTHGILWLGLLLDIGSDIRDRCVLKTRTRSESPIARISRVSSSETLAQGTLLYMATANRICVSNWHVAFSFLGQRKRWAVKNKQHDRKLLVWNLSNDGLRQKVGQIKAQLRYICPRTHRKKWPFFLLIISMISSI